MADPIDIGDDYEAEPVDHDPFKSQMSPTLEGDFPYHPDYLYHGTSDVHSPAIEANGFPPRSYFATSPEIAEIEAQNTAYGATYTHGPKAQGAVGGNPVIYAVPKSELGGKEFEIDPEYEGGEYENGRGLISQHPIRAGAVLSGSEIEAHNATAAAKAGWRAAPMTAPHLVTKPGSGGLVDQEAQIRHAREQQEEGLPPQKGE